MENLFIHHPYLNEVLVWNKKGKKYKNLWQLIKKIRSRQYDAVVNIQRFASSGLITALSKAKVKIGFDKNPLSVFFNHRYPHLIDVKEEYIHEVDRNLQLLQPLCKDAKGRITLYPSDNDEIKLKKFKKQTYICLAPTSLWFTKQFPQERWVEFISKVPKDIAVYLLGGPADRKICDEIIEQSGHPACLNLAGELNLLESAALMKDAKMNYVNDSAPQHLASAMNAPTTAIFCSTVPAFGFGPLSDDSVIVQVKETLNCRPCGLHGHRECPEKHFRCGADIEIKELIDRLCKKN